MERGPFEHRSGVGLRCVLSWSIRLRKRSPLRHCPSNSGCPLNWSWDAPAWLSTKVGTDPFGLLPRKHSGELSDQGPRRDGEQRGVVWLGRDGGHHGLFLRKTQTINKVLAGRLTHKPPRLGSWLNHFEMEGGRQEPRPGAPARRQGRLPAGACVQLLGGSPEEGAPCGDGAAPQLPAGWFCDVEPAGLRASESGGHEGQCPGRSNETRTGN